MQNLEQPQLGKTIVDLRQKKRLTQEELVELCNINVRTLQRIEAGEVTPREYTIRILLDALDYNIAKIEHSIQKKASIKWVKIAWVAGIIYFLVGIFESGLDYVRFEENLPYYFPLLYTATKLMVAVTYLFFMIGFIEIGKYFENALLKIASYLMVASLVVIEVYDIISYSPEMAWEEFYLIKGTEAVVFGGIDIVFGIALLLLGKKLGVISKVAGIFEIIVGAFFITFFLAFIGLIAMVPAIILEIIILYKFYDEMKTQA
ncbi:MAG: helix-turn-helix domain-containing protein [Cyclobacteriaceae bacterium]|nr:helix-turn-helix domain-containing protein [Cyclobacteriaceae bacterium]